MAASGRSRDAVERHEQLARASAARAHQHRRVGLLLISLGIAIWVVPFLVFLVLWLNGTDLGTGPPRSERLWSLYRWR